MAFTGFGCRSDQAAGYSFVALNQAECVALDNAAILNFLLDANRSEITAKEELQTVLEKCVYAERASVPKLAFVNFTTANSN